MKKKFRTHYDNLKIAQDAPPEVVKAAYRSLSMKYHPDRNSDNARAEEIMKIINQSYAVLVDPKLRAEHDAWILEKMTSIHDEHKPTSDNTKTHHTVNTEQSNHNRIKTYPWRRFFAKYTDTTIYLVIFIIIFLISFDHLDAWFLDFYDYMISTYILSSVIYYAFVIPIDAFFITIFGNSFGRLVFGIKILDANGKKLLFGQALTRSYLMVLQGLAFGIFILTLFTQIAGFVRLTRTGTTLWDTNANTIVTHKRWGVLRVLLCTIVMVIMFLIWYFIISVSNGTLKI